jgi:exodeoxyribonuclease VII large subunit
MAADTPLYTITEIVGAVRRTLEAGYGRVRVRGELSGCRRPGSGHLYFTLKDDRAQIRAVMFRGDAVGLRFLPADGVEVEAEGEITLYEARGDLQLCVRRMLPSGLGALMQAFEALKKRLAAEGLFEAARKRPLPPFPRVIGLVSSPTGAAVRDFLRVLSERWPVAEVLFCPVPVQGEEAAVRVADGIRRMGRWGGADVLVVARGGGSLEDLWAFNEEPVVRAIAASPIPVVSAVGHEIDITLADLVADVRAPTPTAAAALVAPSRAEVAERLIDFELALRRSVLDAVAERRERLRRLVAAYGFRRPERFLEREGQRVDELAGRLVAGMEWLRTERRRDVRTAERRLVLQHPRGLVRSAGERVRGAEARLGQGATALLRQARGRLEAQGRTLRALDPTGVLGRGYCLARDPASRRVLLAASDLVAGAPLVVQFSGDRAAARVERVEPGGPWELESVREDRRERQQKE